MKTNIFLNSYREDLKETIFGELNERDIISWHGITKDNIDQILVEPTNIELATWSGQKKNYWLVPDEQPGELVEGYLVVFDETKELFGLATKTAIESKSTGLFSWIVWFIC